MFKRRRWSKRRKKLRPTLARWASVGMPLTFRAEVMPGREASQRTFTVARVLANGRVELVGMTGQHTQTEFQPAR